VQIRPAIIGRMNVPQILTLDEAADFLGVGTPAVAAWARDGHLPACARSESGALLFYRWRVERDGPRLAANEPVRFRKARCRRDLDMFHDSRRLPCGCVFVGSGEGSGEPVWLCPDARALQSVERLTAAFAAAAADDLFICRLARVTADALARHLASTTHETDTADERHRRALSASPETAREVRVT
jgi:hypothetical protein